MAAQISSLGFTMSTAISVRVFEIASLLPDCMGSGVVGVPRLVATSGTLPMLSFV